MRNDFKNTTKVGHRLQTSERDYKVLLIDFKRLQTLDIDYQGQIQTTRFTNSPQETTHFTDRLHTRDDLCLLFKTTTVCIVHFLILQYFVICFADIQLVVSLTRYMFMIDGLTFFPLFHHLLVCHAQGCLCHWLSQYYWIRKILSYLCPQSTSI